jgi:hypothetical protein
MREVGAYSSGHKGDSHPHDRRLKLPCTRRETKLMSAVNSKPEGDATLHVVTRTYSGRGAKELIETVLKHQDEVTGLMRGVKGFVSYVIIKTGDGWMTATMCQDKSGCDESVKIARDWISKNASNTGVGAPQITEGEVLLRVV